MATLNISLPAALRQFVEEQVQSGEYGSASEYIGELIRQDLKRAADERLEASLLEGLDSGEPIEATPEYWDRKRKELIERHTRKAKRA